MFTRHVSPRWVLRTAPSFIVALALSLPVLGTLSVPSFPYFWDNDVDGKAEATDAAVKFYKAGNSWTTAKTDRTTEALAAWRNGTDFDPTARVDLGEPHLRRWSRTDELRRNHRLV